LGDATYWDWQKKNVKYRSNLEETHVGQGNAADKTWHGKELEYVWGKEI
jgi:hypothetical protein